MKPVLLITTLALAACAPRPAEPYVYAYTHAAGYTCPADYTLVRGFFTERDGSREDACAAPAHVHTKYTFDVLKAGESATVTLLAPPRGSDIAHEVTQ
jgi:hypothetical protein